MTEAAGPTTGSTSSDLSSEAFLQVSAGCSSGKSMNDLITRRQKRENFINKPEIYTGYEKEQLKIKERGEQNFVAYFKSLADKRKASNHDNWVRL